MPLFWPHSWKIFSLGIEFQADNHFLLTHWRYYSSLLISVTYENQLPNTLRIIYVFFLLLLRFSCLFLVFYSFTIMYPTYLPKCKLIFILLAWNVGDFPSLGAGVSHWFWKILNHHFVKYCLCSLFPILLELYLDCFFLTMSSMSLKVFILFFFFFSCNWDDFFISISLFIGLYFYCVRFLLPQSFKFQ